MKDSRPPMPPGGAHGQGTGSRAIVARMLSTHIWAVLGALLIVAGTLGSAFAASREARDRAEKSQKAFVSSSAGIAAIVKLAIQHEEDLVTDTGAFVVGEPATSEVEFVQWAQDVRSMQRYPELEGFGETILVPASGLRAYAARAAFVSNNGFAPQGSFVVTPPGNRALYCFSVIGLVRSEHRGGLPNGFDLCAGPRGQALLATRAPGQADLEPITIGNATTLSIAVPIYREGAVTTTALGRSAAFVGWVGVNLIPDVVMGSALDAHPHTAVELRYGAGVSAAVFRDGSAPPGAKTATISLHNGWTVETFADVAGAGVFGDLNAIELLIFGIALSLVLGALIFVLGTGGARSRLQVDERTRQLRYQALHDPLTRLPNRALIIERIDLMLARARRSHLAAAALFVGIDNFKDINETLGHQVGDQVLAAVAARLVATGQEGDTIGRPGADEFVLLVEGSALDAGVEVVADRFLTALDAPFEIPGSARPISITASIGVAAGDRVTADDLLHDANVALRLAKASGKRRAVVFAPSMQAAAQYRHLLASDLRDALADKQFFLLYQPTIDLRTGAFTGVEALLRWQHPDRGVVQPNDFIGALESTDLIVPVGAWVLAEACRQGAAWLARGHRLTVSVNVSTKQLELERIVDDVKAALDASGFDPAMLTLEITETTLMNDVPETIARLSLLKALGVRLAIDDFGTGYSSLSYLKKFPIDILKIDRSFVSCMADSPESAALVHTLVQLGKALDLETIAEGIEDDDQRLRLQAEDVDIGQGFLFSRPIDVAAIDRYVEDFVANPGPVTGGARAVGAAGVTT